jgi:hypothetical protein
MEHETFWTLIKDVAHWEFEIFLMFIFDVLIGLIIWPFLRSFFVHHKSDDDKIAKLEKEVIKLERYIWLANPEGIPYHGGNLLPPLIFDACGKSGIRSWDISMINRNIIDKEQIVKNDKSDSSHL